MATKTVMLADVSHHLDLDNIVSKEHFEKENRLTNELLNYIFDNCLKHIGYERNGVQIDEIKFGNCLTRLFNNNISNNISLNYQNDKI